jgi:hypothetical protein
MAEWNKLSGYDGQLPIGAPVMKPVLLFCPRENFSVAVCIGQFWTGDGNWKRTPNGKCLSPTHWMPLPAAPN